MERINLQRGNVADISAEEQLTEEGRAGFRSVKERIYPFRMMGSGCSRPFWFLVVFLRGQPNERLPGGYPSLSSFLGPSMRD